jgi:site-specific DNA-cytosine methylase
VVLAVDSWAYALNVHRRNHPLATHVCTLLPPSEPLPLPSDGEGFHLHGSPPCTRVSNAYQERNAEERQRALELIDWYIGFALESDADSWSMEQVATPVVLQLLESWRLRSRGRLAYAALDLQKRGVPQRRLRVIAGSRPGPICASISALRSAPTSSRASSIVLIIGSCEQNGRSVLARMQGSG